VRLSYASTYSAKPVPLFLSVFCTAYGVRKIVLTSYAAKSASTSRARRPVALFLAAHILRFSTEVITRPYALGSSLVHPVVPADFRGRIRYHTKT
jgi:hypothetical protein